MCALFIQIRHQVIKTIISPTHDSIYGYLISVRSVLLFAIVMMVYFKIIDGYVSSAKHAYILRYLFCAF